MRLDGAPSLHSQEFSGHCPFCFLCLCSSLHPIPSSLQCPDFFPRNVEHSFGAVVNFHKLSLMDSRCIEQPFTLGLFWTKWAEVMRGITDECYSNSLFFNTLTFISADSFSRRIPAFGMQDSVFSEYFLQNSRLFII